MVIPSIYLPKHVYAATNGEVTVWRRSSKRLRSVIIKEFSQQWRVHRPSGPHSYPVIPLTRYQYRKLVLLGEGMTMARIDNTALPDDLKVLMASKLRPECDTLEPVMAAF